jgi:hypothetical protein
MNRYKAILPARIFTVFLLAIGVSACPEDKSEPEDTSQGEQTSVCGVQLAGVSLTSTQELSEDELPSFGDGSDGEFYLSAGATSYLRETTYNYSNVYLEPGSTLLMSDAFKAGIEEVTINSVGTCYLLGDIELSEYQGTLNINCYGGLDMGETGTISTSGSIRFQSTSTVSIGEDVFIPSSGSLDMTLANSDDSDVTVSSGSIDASISITGDNSITPVSDSSDTPIIVDEFTIDSPPISDEEVATNSSCE